MNCFADILWSHIVWSSYKLFCWYTLIWFVQEQGTYFWHLTLLNDAHFTSSGLFSFESVSLLFSLFLYLWIFKSCNTVNVFHCKYCVSFYWCNFLHCVLWKYCQNIHSITSSRTVSHFCLTLFASSIPPNHDGHHKLDTWCYLFSQCLLPPV